MVLWLHENGIRLQGGLGFLPKGQERNVVKERVFLPKHLRHFLSGMCLYNLLEGKQCCVMWYLEDGAQGLVVNADCMVP